MVKNMVRTGPGKVLEFFYFKKALENLAELY